jgi:hypothetical protein
MRARNVFAMILHWGFLSLIRGIRSGGPSSSTLRRATGALLVAFLFASPAKATSCTTDVSDIWYIPSESGWGVQLVQEGCTVFATVFIYGTTGQPTWAVATMQNPGGLTWSGSLFTTTGPYFGTVPFNPAGVSATPAGTMTFQLITVESGLLTYSINGVTVTKGVSRQTLVNDNYNGHFAITVHLRASSCSSASLNVDVAAAETLAITQSGSTMSMIATFTGGSTCTYNGSYTQSGKVGSFDGTYTCSGGEIGHWTMFEMTNRTGMISGRLTGASSNLGCQYKGYFSGIDPSLPAQ